MSDDEQQEVYDDENVGDEVEAEQDEQQGETEEQTGDAPVEATIKKVSVIFRSWFDTHSAHHAHTYFLLNSAQEQSLDEREA